MDKKLQKLSYVLAVCLSFSVFCSEASSEKGLPVRIESDRLVYFEDTGLVEGWGNVRVTRGDVRLRADYARFNLLTGDMFAEGDVSLSDLGEELTASSLEYRFPGGEARAYGVEVFQSPWFLESDEFEQDSPEKHRMRRASATTCDRERPHYRFTASRIEVEPGVVMRAYHAFFYIGRMPVFYLPYYRRSLKDIPSGYVIRPGYSSERGFFALSYYHWYISQNLRGRWHLDYFENLGWGKGFDTNFSYGGSMPGNGFLYLYHIDEKESPGDDSEPSERWKAHLRHSQRFSDYTRSILRIDMLSDPDFNRDYMTDETLRFLRRSELETHRPEGSLSITTRKPNHSTNVFFRQRVNDFTTVVENLPRVSFDLSEQSIGESGLYLSFNSDLANLNLSPSEGEGSLLQARISPGISYQARIRQIRMNPSIAGDGFWYDRGSTGEKNIFQGSYEFRLPVNLANGVWRIYDTPGWGGITQTRHLIVPRATYFYRPEPGAGRDDLLSFADRVGDESESVRLEVGNIVEGRHESGRKFRFLYLNLFADYNLLAEELPWSNVHGDIRANSTRDVYLNSRISYNTYIDRFESLNADIGMRRRGWDFEVGCRIYEPGGEKHTLDFVSRARGDVGENWGLDLQARYDYNEGEFKALRAGVTRDLHCWEMQIFWEREGERTRVMAGFRIKGVPGAALRSPY